VTLRRVGEIEVPRGAKPGFDHADVFTGRGGSRMYVAHTGADRVDVFDCASATYLHALEGHPGVAGVLIDSELDLMLTTDRGAERLSSFRVSDETLVARFTVGQRPNGVALDTRQLRAYTFDLGEPPGTGCTSTVVDLATSAVLARIELPGRPRWAVYDPSSRSIYANISEPPCIVVVDTGTQGITRTIDVPSAGPHGLALIDGLLFCATDAGELVVLDVAGTVRRKVPLAGVPDVVMYDRDLARAYVAIGSPGVVQSFDTTSLRMLETVETEESAHTIGWDPSLKQLWAFAPRSCGAILYQESGD
jgi:DNA-binding beta-propeller fold protein YncE